MHMKSIKTVILSVMILIMNTQVSWALSSFPCLGITNRPFVKAYDNSDLKSDIRFILGKDEMVTVLGEGKRNGLNWYRIEYNDDSYIYVLSDSIDIDKTKPIPTKKPKPTKQLKPRFEFYDDVGKWSKHNLTVTARVKNASNKGYNYIRIKAVFEDKNGEILDTNWTYLVTDVVLEPQESKTFSISVPRNDNITSYTLSILDYNEK